MTVLLIHKTTSTYLPTQSGVLLEKLTVVNLVKKFCTCCGIQGFITIFTRACHWSLCWHIYVQSTPSHPVSL